MRARASLRGRLLPPGPGQQNVQWPLSGSAVAIQPFKHSDIVAIVSIVGPAWMGIHRHGCLSVRLMDLTGRGHGWPDTEHSTTANRARWIAAVRGGKSKRAGGGKHKSGFRSGSIETKQSVPCLPVCLCLMGGKLQKCALQVSGVDSGVCSGTGKEPAEPGSVVPR